MLVIKPPFAQHVTPNMEYIKTATWTRDSAYPYRGAGDSYRFFPERMYRISETDFVVLSKVWQRINSSRSEYYVDRWRNNPDRTISRVYSMRVPETGIEIHTGGGDSRTPTFADAYMHNGKLIVAMIVPVNWRAGSAGEIDQAYFDQQQYRWIDYTADARHNRVVFSFPEGSNDVIVDSDTEYTYGLGDLQMHMNETAVRKDVAVPIGLNKYAAVVGITNINGLTSTVIKLHAWKLDSAGAMLNDRYPLDISVSANTGYELSGYSYDIVRVGPNRALFILTVSTRKVGGPSYENSNICSTRLVDFSGSTPSMTLLEEFDALMSYTGAVDYDPYSPQKRFQPSDIISGQKNLFNDIVFSDGTYVNLLYMKDGSIPLIVYDPSTELVCASVGKTFSFFREDSGQLTSIKSKVVSDLYDRIEGRFTDGFLHQYEEGRFYAGSFIEVEDDDNSDVWGYQTIALAGFARIDFNLLNIFGPDIYDDPDLTSQYDYIRTYGNKNYDTYWINVGLHSVVVNGSVITMTGESAYGESTINDPFDGYFLILDVEH